MDMLKIERIGGLAGFGLARSHIQSSGEQAVSALSTADQAAVDRLFQGPTEQAGAGAMRDGFRYRITRSVAGREQTVEAPEAAVPSALKNCVTDRLR